MEALAFSLGVSVAKAVVRLWTRDTVLAAADEGLVDLVTRTVKGARQQRAARRQFEEVAEYIADRLAPFLTAEARGIDEGELQAAVSAADESLKRAHALTPATMLAVNLDSARLSELIKARDPRAVLRAGLGEAGQGVYDTLVTECAGYIVAISHKLPAFQTAKARDALERMSELSRLAKEILDGLPASAVPLEWGRGSEDDRFENKYRRAVSERCENVQLFGVTSATAQSPYPLSVAYISLTVEELSTQSRNRSHNDAESRRDSPGDSDSGDVSGPLRIESLLEASDRLLLTGGAGSGKTTLVQWIALSSIARSSESPLAEAWQSRVPFVVPLRRFVELEFPRPEQFVETIAPNLIGTMPVGWVHRVLAAGRATLLFDGLDEVPTGRREDAHKWVRQLLTDFPDSKVLVTSRSSAVTKAWADEEMFRHAELQPMDAGDTRSFVAHWHSAARAANDPADEARIDDAESAMLAVVRDRPAIRALCNSPLLCALICALNLERGSTLPTDRMELYRTALEMLISRRDSDRKIDAFAAVDLSFSQREYLLRTFALWMHENGASDARKTDYEAKIRQASANIYGASVIETTLSTLLLERSGVLREPVVGRVDFVHRTFLEYLAAAAVVDDNSIEKLILVAHEDHWREVIIMAAGHANGPQRERLLNGLLDRGEADERVKHRLYLLAVASMETSKALTPELRTRLHAALREVLPPTNMTDAAAVASAGSLAVANLGARPGQKALTAAACIRALSLIGGDDALRALSSYGRDDRVTVTRQLIRAWSSFDTERFAREVLVDSPLERGRLLVNDPEQAKHIDHLRGAIAVYLDVPARTRQRTDLPRQVPRMYGMDLSRSKWVTSIKVLPQSNIPLRSLSLNGCPLPNLFGLEEHSEISYLSLAHTAHLQDAASVAALSSLRYLNLSDSALPELDFWSESLRVDTLELSSAPFLRSLGSAVNAKTLRLGFAPHLADVQGLSRSSTLERLSLHGPLPLVDEFVLPDSLRSLASFSSHSFNLAGGPNLVDLNLEAEVIENTFDWIKTLRKLRRIEVSLSQPDPGAEESLLHRITRLTSVMTIDVVRYGSRSEAPNLSGWSRSSRRWSRVRYTRNGE